MCASQPHSLKRASSHSALSRSCGEPTWLGAEAMRASHPPISLGSTSASSLASMARSAAAAPGEKPVMPPGAEGPGLAADALSGFASSSARSPLKLVAGGVGLPGAGGGGVCAAAVASEVQARSAGTRRRSMRASVAEAAEGASPSSKRLSSRPKSRDPGGQVARVVLGPGSASLSGMTGERVRSHTANS